MEDFCDDGSGELSIGDEVEVPDKAVCDEGASSTRGAHGGEEDDILEFHELEVLAVVPSLVVKELPEQLDGRLSSVGFLLGHVEVVDEDDATLSDWWAINSLPSLLHFGVDCILSLIDGRLS